SRGPAEPARRALRGLGALPRVGRRGPRPRPRRRAGRTRSHDMARPGTGASHGRDQQEARRRHTGVMMVDETAAAAAAPAAAPAAAAPADAPVPPTTTHGVTYVKVDLPPVPPEML